MNARLRAKMDIQTPYLARLEKIAADKNDPSSDEAAAAVQFMYEFLRREHNAKRNSRRDQLAHKPNLLVSLNEVDLEIAAFNGRCLTLGELQDVAREQKRKRLSAYRKKKETA